MIVCGLLSAVAVFILQPRFFRRLHEALVILSVEHILSIILSARRIGTIICSHFSALLQQSPVFLLLLIIAELST